MSALPAAASILVRVLSRSETMPGSFCNSSRSMSDIDFCLRLRQPGYRTFWTPLAELIHLEPASRGRHESPERHERFLGEVRYKEARREDWLQCDTATTGISRSRT